MPQAAEKLFIFLFVLQDEDITELSSLREAGLKADISASVLDKMETLIQTEPVKEKLKRNTQEALDEGVSRRFSTNPQLVHLFKLPGLYIRGVREAFIPLVEVLPPPL